MKNLWGEKPYESILTIPNIITFLGIVSIVFYSYGFLTNSRWLLGITLFLAGLRDLLDGVAARRLKQRTRIGEAIDPLRDRLLLLAVLLNIIYLNFNKFGFILFWGGVIGGFELLTAFYNLTLVCPEKRKVLLIGKLRQAGHLLLAGFVLLSRYFQDIIYSIFRFDFNFTLESALPIMAICSCAAFICYVCRAKRL